MSSFKTIDREDLKKRLDRLDRIQIVNVLAPEYAYLGSIPGSHKIPVNELAVRAGELKQNLDVVTYCAGPQCDASRRAAEILDSLGFRVSAYEGGLREWKKAGFRVEGESAGPSASPDKKKNEARVDQELEGSFPASDPPSWSGTSL